MSNTQVDTPYASFNAASREVSSNGGAWYPYDLETTIIPHQSMGGATDLFQLTGVMEARIVIPRDVAQIGDIINELFTFIACEVRMDGDTRDYATLFSLAIPFCPTMSDTLTLPTTPGTLYYNPRTFTFFGETLVTKQTTIYLGNFRFSLNKVDDGIPSNAGSNSSASSNGFGGSTFTASNPTLTSATATSAMSAGEIASESANGTQSAIGSSTITLPNGGTSVVPVFLTTITSQYAASSSARTNTDSSAPMSSKGGSEVRIVAGVLGGLAILAIFLLLIFFRLRRMRRVGKEEVEEEEEKEKEAAE